MLVFSVLNDIGFLKNIYLFILLLRVLVAALGIFVAACGIFLVAACGLLVEACRVEPRPPALGAWSLNHWTTREFPMI